MALLFLVPAEAKGKELSDWVLSAGAGGTYYCIVTRCDTGTVARMGVGVNVDSMVMLELGGRWHSCFDCDQFLIAEGGVQLRREGRRLTPFVAAGAGLSSDPEFMGRKWGAYAAVGTWIALPGAWATQLDIRGRQVGGDLMGEASVSVARIFTRSGS